MGEKRGKEYLIMKESIKTIEYKPKEDSGTGTVEIKLFPRTRSFGYFALKKLTQTFGGDAADIKTAINTSGSLSININSVVLLYERQKVSNPIFAFISIPSTSKDAPPISKKVEVIDFQVTLFDVEEDALMQIIVTVSQELNKCHQFYFRNVNKTVNASSMMPALPIPVVKEDTIGPEI
ncbi:PREDICTED: uncharacterized protein LOC109582057 [Amphimedon queenslandica]|uniref:Uncharacterized protein n=1 Tax=Amphimedon queenslandica TaxID=400682 RepID=A0A1X7UUN5_AMPQE|nr:PREDICTED: uncharacterized protein LOC109582057 [Amphimedon queenslandica]|eukprot:XP_019852184.1 PREDICTED: uncharacterized protein LOC109582057 [Amphimedon queenslandica]